MNLYARALMLCDELASERVSLEATVEGLDLCGEPSEALERRLAAFCALPEAEGEAEFVASVARSTRAPCTVADLQSLLRQARDASAPFRALMAVVRAPSRAARELLGFPVAFAAKLPAPFTVTFRREGTVCVCTTAKQVYEESLGRHPVFVVRELEAAAQGVELGRASAVHLDGWLAAKSRGAWVLTPELAGADLPGHAPAPTLLCFGELFDVLGAELVDVVVHERKEAA